MVHIWAFLIAHILFEVAAGRAHADDGVGETSDRWGVAYNYGRF